MDRTVFEENVGKILKEAGVVDFDKDLYNKFLNEEKKNTLVTVVEFADKKKAFFKTVKPWGTSRSKLEFQKGVIVYNLLGRAGVENFPRIIKKERKYGLDYYFGQVVPIEKTLLDKNLRKFSESDGKRIRKVYLQVKQKINKHLNDEFDPIQTLPLLPQSNFSQNYSFWGLFYFLEENLYKAGLIKKKKAEKFILSFLEDVNRLSKQNKLYLLHGDFAPHNIVYGKRVYFVDWERAILTQIPYLGEMHDLANLYVYSWINPKFQKAFWQNSLSFKVSLFYHLVYKSWYVTTYKLKHEQKFLAWMLTEYERVNLQ